MLCCSSWDGTVRAWSVPNGGKPQHVLTYRHAAPALCACWQGRDAAAAVVSGGGDNAVRRVAMGKLTLTLTLTLPLTLTLTLTLTLPLTLTLTLPLTLTLTLSLSLTLPLTLTLTR